MRPLQDTLLGWRSILFVPANVPKFVEKATQRGADAILLDLEDAIAPDQKHAAREILPGAIAAVSEGRSDVGVRINRPLGLAIRDIEVAVEPAVSFLALPKVESAEHVRLLEEAVEDVERTKGIEPGRTRFLVNIESASAYFQMLQIASAHPRVVAMALGSEDFSSSCGFEPSGESLFGPKQAALIAARAAGIQPVGFLGSVANVGDIESFRQVIRRSRQFGFTCGYAVHPTQVAVLNEEFSPSSSEIKDARALVEAADAHSAGAFSFKGMMVDKPIIERARAILHRADHVARMSAR